MGEWPLLTLREAGVALTDCEHRTPASSPTGRPYVAIPQLKEGRVDLSAARLISDADFEEWTRKARPQLCDVILSRRCNPGESAVVTAGIECALGQNLVLLRADGRRVLPAYLRWLLRGPAWWGQVGRFINVGAVFDSLKCADIPEFELPIPPLDVQKNIADILGALDDKIDLNRRMSETLEEIAWALFRSWFMDFDPVRAKMEGRDPGLPSEFTGLFPDSFADSEMGELPSGWHVGSIAELAEVVGGTTPSTSNTSYWEGGEYAWVTPKDLAALDSPCLLRTDRKITAEGLAVISSGLLPVGTVLLSSRAPIGYRAIAEIPVAINQGFIALRPKRSVPSSFLFHWLGFAHDEIVSRANGSTFLEISKSNFRPIPIVVPPPTVLNAFGFMARPLHDAIRLCARQSESLTTLRDTLLPKLISGELRIPDLEAA